ncbi:MAG: ATP synthase F1 subunit gamma [Flavobacteriales bacterium]|jgi:F-type H+-transporting ATPase subunit gamma|nr:ATP synthase F1 subunit gamma [Flavobacteriales bacterium]
MANLKELRTRIGSVQSTMQITSAMKMVSAAKLKRAQDAITQMRPYADKLKELLENLSASLGSSADGKYSEKRDIKKVLLIVVSSNRGLCGAFNTRITKELTRARKEEYPNADVSVLPIGKKVVEFAERREMNLFDSNISIFDNLTFDASAAYSQKVMDAFVNEEFDRVDIIYSKFYNAGRQDVIFEQFLPVKPIESDETSAVDYGYEPSKEEIITDLIPKSLKMQVFKALLDSHASEHGARMTAMHKATDNATALRDDLKLQYNRQRQAAITNEILEIVGGAEALG